MKLTISRTVQQKGIFRKVTVFYLNVDIDVSSEEMALLEKERWQYEPVYSGQREGRFYHSDGRERSLATVSLKWPDVCWKENPLGFRNPR